MPIRPLHLITYADHNYRISSWRLCRQARRTGWFRTITRLSPRHLPISFKSRYSDILSQSRGAGYWIWKPKIISTALARISINDYLLYMDAGSTINHIAHHRLSQYFDILDESSQGILSMQMAHVETAWTNTATLKYFSVSLKDDIAMSGQLIATILLIKNTSASQLLINRWLSALEDDPHLFTDRYNNTHRINCFLDHRHDQSIFSLIRKLDSPTIVPDETWFEDFGGFDASRVPFWGTRLRDSRRMLRKYCLNQI